MADRLGAIWPGCLADVILFDGDPLTQIGALTDPERIRLVMKAGVIEHGAQTN